MKHLTLFIGACFYVTFSIAQPIEEGFFVRPAIWINNSVQTSEEECMADATLFNYNSSSVQSPNQVIDIPTSTHLSVYSAFNPLFPEGQEGVIWSLSSNELPLIIQTTKRTADLGRARHYPNRNTEIEHGAISTFITSLKGRQINTLTLGVRPIGVELPVVDYGSAIPEILVYSKILSESSQAIVESYLAIKYGISLEQEFFHDYVTGNGHILWRPIQNEGFRTRVTGLGRDDITGLYQRQSKSSNSGAIVSISVGSHRINNCFNDAVIPNQNFLIWSDNNEELFFEEDSDNSFPRLGRRWRIYADSAFTSLSTQLTLDMLKLAEPYDREATFWLVNFSNSAQENPPLENILATKGYYHAKEAKIFFDSLVWDVDASGVDEFTFAKGEDFLPIVRQTEPNCNEENGLIEVKIFDGTLPIRCVLSSNRFREEKVLTQLRQIATFANLESEIYELELKDATGAIVKKSIFLNSKGFEAAPLLSTYHIVDDTGINLDARGIGMENSFFTWLRDGQVITHNPKITIHSPGEYLLRAETEGCSFQQSIHVKGTSHSIVRWTEIFPNPVRVGQELQLRLKLNSLSSSRVKIFDASGRQLESYDLGSGGFHLFQKSFRDAGSYLLRVEVGQESLSFKVIVFE